MSIAVQCDFDGTITEEDVGFAMLDVFAGDSWRQVHEDYEARRIPVGVFNKKVFAMIKEDRATLTDFVLKSSRVKLRPGFNELQRYCSSEGHRLIIVSNGLLFYIEAIIGGEGIDGIEVFAAQNEFGPSGMKVAYIGPDGREVLDGFKEAYTRQLQEQGYRVIYVGNGTSDINSARMADHVFATGELLRLCREENLACVPFDDFHEVIRGIKGLPSG